LSLEEGPEIGKSLAAPVMDDHPIGTRLDQVEGAATGDEPDDSLAVR